MTAYPLLQGKIMESIHLSAYDIVIAGIVVLFLARGIWLGMLRQVIPLLALYLGYLAARRYHDQLFPFLKNISDNPKVVFLAAYVITFALTYVVAFLFGKALGRVIQITITPWFDRILGAFLGLAKALILVILVHMLLGTLMAPENEMLRTCRSCPTLNKMSDFTRELIKDPEIREALRHKKPAIVIEEMSSMLSQDEDEEQTTQEIQIAPE
ncbi:MAG: CvpA family protein [Desulfobulbaceae bacterium]|nr:MAG: CvpA family protein [Desulfobulbaceae bacterium]